MNPLLQKMCPSISLVAGLLTIFFYEIQVGWKWKIKITARIHFMDLEYTGSLLNIFEAAVCLGVIFSLLILCLTDCFHNEIRRHRWVFILNLLGTILLTVGLICVVWFCSRSGGWASEWLLLAAFTCGAVEFLSLLVGALVAFVYRPRQRDDFYVAKNDVTNDETTIYNSRGSHLADAGSDGMGSGKIGVRDDFCIEVCPRI